MNSKTLCDPENAPAHRHRPPPIVQPASLLAQSALRRMTMAVAAMSVLWLGVLWAIAPV